MVGKSSEADAEVGFVTNREGDNDETPDAAATRDKLNQALIQFWRQQLRDVHALNQPLVEFKNHPLPLARIKKIMKSDEDTDNIPAAAVAAANDGTAHIPSTMYAGMAGVQPGLAGGMAVPGIHGTGQPVASTSQAGMHPIAMQVPTSCQPMMMPATEAVAPNAVPGAPAMQPPQPQHSMTTADGTPQQYYQYFQWPGMPGQPMMMPQGGGPMMMPQQVMSMPGGPAMAGMPAGVPQGMHMMQMPGGGAVPMMQHGQPMQFVHMPPQDPKMQGQVGQGPAPGQPQWWQGGPSGEGPR